MAARHHGDYREVILMQNDQVESIRPFARMMAIEAPTESIELMAENGVLRSLPSGHVINDWPDGFFGG